jgi:hypothetical protein
LEYDFLVAPGASPKAITLAIAGTGHDADAPLQIDGEGDLVATLDDGQVRFHKPVVYQVEGAEKNYVDGRYVPRSAHEVGFEIPVFDPMKTLVIDPTLAEYKVGTISTEQRKVARFGGQEHETDTHHALACNSPCNRNSLLCGTRSGANCRRGDGQP